MTAWHLNNNCVGNNAPERFTELAEAPFWWETLLLWAALLNDQSQERAEKLLQTMLESQHIVLVGMMLADGVGTEAIMDRWVREFADSLVQMWPGQTERCARVWQASRQENRRKKLIMTLRDKTVDANWLAWLRLTQFLEQIGDRTEVPVSHPESSYQSVIPLLKPSKTFSYPIASSKQFAGAQVLSGIDRLWPSYPEGLLYLWPSERQRLTVDLQRLASVKVDRVTLLSHIRQKESNRSILLHSLASNLYTSLINASDSVHKRDTQQDHYLALYVARDLARYLNRYLTDHHNFDLANKEANNLALYMGHDLISSLAYYFASDLAYYMNLAPQSLSHYLGIDITSKHERTLDLKTRRDDRVLGLARNLAHASQKLDSTFVNLAARLFPGTAILRSSLCSLTVNLSSDISDKYLPLHLLSSAARISVGINTASQELAESIAVAEKKEVDAFWIAYARHIARLSTADDRLLLEDLAAHPEKREAPLSWALQYIVRGDILLPDGSEVTLDELCAEAGVPPYPLLEDMPPELEWEDEVSDNNSE